MKELKVCPCGEIPEALQISPSNTSKWAYASGTCCGEWMVEFQTKYNLLGSTECMTLAIEAWNYAPRTQKIAQAIKAGLKQEK